LTVESGDRHVIRAQITGDIAAVDSDMHLPGVPQTSPGSNSHTTSPPGSSKKRKAEEDVDPSLPSPDQKKHIISAGQGQAGVAQGKDVEKIPINDPPQATRDPDAHDGEDAGCEDVEDDGNTKEQGSEDVG